MYKQILAAASLALCLAGPAAADDDRDRDRSKVMRELQSKQAKVSERRRGHDRDRGDVYRSWRDHDRRRDDDWRRRGWSHDGWRNDGWRHYRGHDHRHWRYVPPARYRLDAGYRSGYELAWRDWLSHGRHDRRWRRSSFYGHNSAYAYRSGYDAGWRDAATYYGRGYRPSYWSYDPYGGWFFGFSISG